MQHYNKEDLTTYISLCKRRLKKILHRLEWSEEGVLKDFNTNSNACLFKDVVKKPLTQNIITYPDSCETKNSLVLETKSLQELLQNAEVEAPRNFRELQANFTREQKLQIYKHVIEKTEKIENSAETQPVKGETSLADILAQKKREEKHKKRKFRKSKPTHIEEVRSLVDLQMQALLQFMGNRVNKEKRIAEPKGINYNADKEGNYSLMRHKDIRKQDAYYKKEKTNGDRIKGDRTFQDFGGSLASRSKEFRYERNCFQKSRSKEFRYEQNRYQRSRSKELSSNRSRCYEIDQCSKSKEKKKRGSQEQERRRSRSKSKDQRSSSRSIERRKKGFGRSLTSRSKEFRYERNRYKRSRSKELSSNRSCCYERDQSCKSKERKKRESKEEEHKRSRSKSKDQRSSSRSKERRKRNRSSSKERRRSKSRSCDSFLKHNKRDYNYYEENSRHNITHYKKHSRSPETSTSKKYFYSKTLIGDYYEKDKNTTSRQSKIHDDYNNCSKGTSRYKSSKH